MAPPANNSRPRLTAAMNYLTVSVVVVLGVIGAIAATAHVITGSVIDAQRDSATVVNVSGRQRMLSQRIALLAGRYDGSHSDSDRQRLSAAIDLFETSHTGLVEGSSDMALPETLPPSVQDIYFGQRLDLDRRTKAFIAVARRSTLDGGEGETAFHELRTIAMGEVADEQSFLYALNAAVDAFADHHAEQILTLRKSQSTAMIVFVCALVIGTLVIVRPMLRRVTAMADNLDELAVTDPMTSALNRRGFMLRGAELIESAPRCAVLVIDIDHFKRVNDVFGHAAGDTCIRHVASLAKEVFRASDVFGRIGGEEFGAVLADVSLDTALLVAERLSEVVRSTPCDVASVLRRAETVDVTISVGVAVCDIGSRLELIMQQADSALYQAKRAGRDRVLSFEQSQSLVLGEFSPTSTRVRSSGQA